MQKCARHTHSRKQHLLILGQTLWPTQMTEGREDPKMINRIVNPAVKHSLQSSGYFKQSEDKPLENA